MKSFSSDENFCIIQLVQETEKSIKTTEKQIFWKIELKVKYCSKYPSILTNFRTEDRIEFLDDFA